jgi:chromosome segregation ATPase
MEFEYNIMKREHDKLVYENSQFKSENESLMNQVGELQEKVISIQENQNFSVRELQRLKHENEVKSQDVENFKNEFEREVREREAESKLAQAKITDLEEQLAEYEEEFANMKAKNDVSSIHPTPKSTTSKKKPTEPEASSPAKPEPAKSAKANEEEIELTPEQQIAELKKRLKRDE